jgi:hydroxymethylpyrimidine pyrophosphatase-like HAD family hydrolase
MRFRLVASDVDGTLLRSDETLSPRNHAAVNASIERAIFVIATGRPPRWTEPIAEMLGHHGVAVCSNGAVTVDLRDNSIVDTQPLSPNNARAAVDAIRGILPDVGFAIDSLDGFGHEPAYTPMWPTGTLIPFDDLLAKPSLKLLFRHRSMDGHVYRAIAAEIGAYASLIYGSTASEPHATTTIEIMGRDVSKAAALQRICDRHNIAVADTIAFGDMPNDLEMLAWAGHGVAMGNGHADVKAIANEVTVTNDEDGVGVVLERELAGT